MCTARPGNSRAAAPADKIDKAVNVSVMEELNTDVRGNKHLRRSRNRPCDSTLDSGVRFGAPCGAVERSFGEALCIQISWDARQVSYEYAGQSGGCWRSANFFAQRGHQSRRHPGIRQSHKTCRRNATLVVGPSPLSGAAHDSTLHSLARKSDIISPDLSIVRRFEPTGLLRAVSPGKNTEHKALDVTRCYPHLPS